MATYQQISDHVRKHYKFVPKTCWIAHVLSEYGLTKRVAPNRHNLNRCLHPCPDNRRPAIESALRHFAMI
jgi:hypothetical protein